MHTVVKGQHLIKCLGLHYVASEFKLNIFLLDSIPYITFWQYLNIIFIYGTTALLANKSAKHLDTTYNYMHRLNHFSSKCFLHWTCPFPLRWRDDGRDGVLNHHPHHCLLNHLFRRRSKKTSRLRVIGFFADNSPVYGEFPAQIASNAESVSIQWRLHAQILSPYLSYSPIPCVRRIHVRQNCKPYAYGCVGG